MTGNNIRQQLKKLTDAEKVKRFDKGIYYLPKKSIFKSGSKPTLEKVLEYKYLRDNDRRCGYISGLLFFNQMGLTTQVPMQYEIVSNKATNEYQETSLAKSRIIIRKPKVPVTEKNYIDRTLADKVFAICDYYLQGKVQKHSRHIYDIYKLLPLVPQDETFKNLVHEVRNIRAQSPICPSALPDVNVPQLLKQIIEEKAYKNDYDNLTTQLLEEKLSYDIVINSLKDISKSGIFVSR